MSAYRWRWRYRWADRYGDKHWSSWVYTFWKPCLEREIHKIHSAERFVVEGQLERVDP